MLEADKSSLVQAKIATSLPSSVTARSPLRPKGLNSLLKHCLSTAVLKHCFLGISLRIGSRCGSNPPCGAQFGSCPLWGFFCLVARLQGGR